MRNLEVIGEAAGHLTPEFRQQFAEIPWKDIIGFRNIAIHGYFRVDLNIVWEIAHRDVPELMPKLENMLGELDRRSQ